VSSLTITLDSALLKQVRRADELWKAYEAAEEGTTEEYEHGKRWELAKSELAFLFISLVQREENANDHPTD